MNKFAAIALFLNIFGTHSFNDYKYVVNGISKCEGVSNLIQTRANLDGISLNGSFDGDAEAFLTSAQTLALDRFKFDFKKDDDKIVVTFKKI